MAKTLLELLAVISMAVLSIILLQPVSAQNRSHKELLLAKLFGEDGNYTKYSKYIPPNQPPEILKVFLNVELKRIIELDDKSEQLTASVHYYVVWSDKRLSWSKADYGGVDRIHLSAKLLWLPTIYVLNNARENGGRLGFDDEIVSQMVTVTDLGRCTWHTDTISVTECSVDVRFFPFDRQNCTLQYESFYSYSQAKILLQLNAKAKIAGTVTEDDGEWILHSPTFENLNVSKFGNPNNSYSVVNVYLPLQRRSFYYIVNFVVPCCAFSFINLIAFLVRPDSGERVGVSISILLGIVVYQMIINDKLPETSETMPVLGIYIEYIMVTAILSTIVFITVAFCYRKEPRLPNAVRRFLCVHLVRLMCIEAPHNDDDEQSANGKTRQDSAAYGTQLDSIKTSTSGNGQGLVPQEDDLAVESRAVVTRDPSSPRSTEDLLGEILLVLQRMETNAKNQQTISSCDPGQSDLSEPPISPEWLSAAHAIDRCFLLICCLLCAISNLYLMIVWLLA